MIEDSSNVLTFYYLKIMWRFSILLIIILILSCTKDKKKVAPSILYKEYTSYSSVENKYQGFNSVLAINKLAEIENDYFNIIDQGNISPYYGTIWRKEMEANGQYLNYTRQLNQLGLVPDSMHCTLYAYDALKAGFSENDFNLLEEQHREIWKDREVAGWSIGHLLVRDFNWKAYLILDKDSHELERCLTSYRKEKSYPVWKQPNIYLEDCLIRGEDNEIIDSLLAANEFSWGFSDQGYHTWITRYNELKECNWLGAPANSSHDFGNNIPLFLKTPFLDYHDYQSHVLVFPPKKS